MIRERGEPAIADTSKPIIEPPVFPDVPENTTKTRAVAQDPDLLADSDNDDDEDETDDAVVDELDDDDDIVEPAEPAVYNEVELLEDEDEDDDI